MFGLFHVLQLVCGQDLRSFVSKTYVRMWGTLACASESHENIRPSLSFGHLPRNGENYAGCWSPVYFGNLDFWLRRRCSRSA